MDIKIIYYIGNTRKSKICNAINTLNSIQDYFYFNEKVVQTDVCTTEEVSWNKFCDNYSVFNSNNYEIYITEKTFDDNYFLHNQTQYAIISIDEWEELFSPPSLKAYLMYLITEVVVDFEAGINEIMESRIIHKSTMGCVYDFCANKEDIKLGMQTGIICHNCKGTLIRYGVSSLALEAAEKILKHVRIETIGWDNGRNSLTDNIKYYDVFISYANKDKEDFVEELHKSLKMLDIKIFYDKETIKWGDNWKNKILTGTDMAEFAIIVISENFFGREWTEKELNEFLSRQNKDGQKLILPILHNITVEQLYNKYPTVADIQAIDSAKFTCDQIALLFAQQLIKRLKNI